MLGSAPEVSATTTGAIVGSIVPLIGTALGAGIGAVVDVVRSVLGGNKQIRKLKKQFNQQLIDRYNKTVFNAVLQRMAPAMARFVALGLRPGTAAYENALVKELTALGYKGDCYLTLYAPAFPGQERPLLARIDKNGVVTDNNPSINAEHGKQWSEACKNFYAEALTVWAADQKDQAEFNRSLEEQRLENEREVITQVLVASGIALLIFGYIYQQKQRVSRRGEK